MDDRATRRSRSRKRSARLRCAFALPALCVALAGCATPLVAQEGPGATPANWAPAGAPETQAGPSYADLVSLAQVAELAVIVAIADQVQVPAERAPGLEAGKARLYLEAATETLLAGRVAVGESLTFLADRELTARGRAPDLEDQRFLLFARAVPGRPGELQLVSPAAMLPAAPMLIERTRTVLRQIADSQNLPEVTGVREVISIAGNLAGESETQIFLKTARGEPVSLSILRRPGMTPEWGVSWTEIVDQAATAPQPETLEWYRLACFLPPELPGEGFLQNEANARARAREDYAFVLEALGPCGRTGL